jgi:hypothetical protein
MFTRALGTTTTGFEGQWRFLADVQGLGTAAGRHPSADLLPVFNASYRALREWVTSLGYTQFIRRGTTTTLPTSPVEAGENYAIIDVGTSGTPGSVPTLEQIKRVDVKFSGTDWYELPEVTLLQLRDLSRGYVSGTPNRPLGWCWLNAGSITGTTAFVKGEIAVAPVPTSGSYCLWSMTEQPDLINVTDVWLYHTEDWCQWHMFHAMLKVCGVRDKDTAKKVDAILWQLNPDQPGSCAHNIMTQRPTASGPRTWTRSNNYRGIRRW